MKCIIVINSELPKGLIANTCAVLALSIGKVYPEIVGPDVFDKDQTIHAGITQIPIPILKGDSELITNIYAQIKNKGTNDVMMIDFCDVAQKSKKYEDYISKMERTSSSELNYLGIAICGSKKNISKLTGSIPLLR